MSMCHADRAKALKRVADAGARLEFVRRQLPELGYAVSEAVIAEHEAECLAAARALCEMADCSA